MTKGRKAALWIVGVIFGLIFIGSLADNTITQEERLRRNQREAAAEDERRRPPDFDPDEFARGIRELIDEENAEPPEPIEQWSMINFVNEFGERTDRGAVSATVGSIRPMSFPYADATGRIFVDCDSAWMRFSDSPNLTGGDTQSGYSIHSVTVRVDGNNAGRWRVRQPWGDKDLYFLDDSRVIAALSSGSKLDVALPWYGERSAVFSWSLNRSSEMIRESCD